MRFPVTYWEGCAAWTSRKMHPTLCHPNSHSPGYRIWGRSNPPAVGRRHFRGFIALHNRRSGTGYRRSYLRFRPIRFVFLPPVNHDTGSRWATSTVSVWTGSNVVQWFRVSLK